MRNTAVPSIALAACLVASAAFAVPAPSEPLVRGKTTVADTEQCLGAPADTTMRDDGALTLIYPAQRVAEHMALAKPQLGQLKASRVALRFTRYFTFVDAVPVGAGTSLAAR